MGDLVEIGGGVRKASSRFPRVLNLEFLRVISLKPQYQWINPNCNCGRIMESAGHEKGYRCRECGAKNRTGRKIPREMQRTISIGLYQPPPRAQRHLTKPVARIGKEKVWTKQKLKPEWYSFKNSEFF
jgi:tRNA(Ile2)-agmatinylcytidine synthase